MDAARELHDAWAAMHKALDAHNNWAFKNQYNLELANNVINLLEVAKDLLRDAQLKIEKIQEQEASKPT